MCRIMCSLFAIPGATRVHHYLPIFLLPQHTVGRHTVYDIEALARRLMNFFFDLVLTHVWWGLRRSDWVGIGLLGAHGCRRS